MAGLEQAVTHEWALTPREAVQLQQSLRQKVELKDRLGRVARVAGIDVGFEAGGAITRAAVAVLEFPGLTPLEEAVARQPTRFPYVPGLLSFRELPAVLAALGQMSGLPDVVLCDGQGIAHPRRFGIACHLGVLLDIPTIGVAKSRLIGEHGAVPPERGAWTPLLHQGEIIGAVLRTRTGVRPLYVSPGHRVGLATAVEIVMACTPRYRLPETTRRADRLASGKGQ